MSLTDPGDVAARRALLLERDEQFAAALPDDHVTAVVRQPGRSLDAVVATVMDGYAERPAYGERATEPVRDRVTGRTVRRLLPHFDTVSYGELWRRAGALAAAWHHDEHEPIRAGEVVATLGSTGGDYATVELALIRVGAVGVPLPGGSAPGQLLPLVHETTPRVLAVDVEHLDTAADIVASGTSLRRLVVFGHHPDVDDERDRIDAVRDRLAGSGHGVVVETLPEVLGRGAALPPAPSPPADEDRLALVIYTSGTTGSPKGAMYTARLIAELWRGFFPERPGLPLIDVGFLPMSHLAGRAVLFSTLARGGTTYFVGRSDLSTLFEDLALVRPTVLLLVPRIAEAISQQYQLLADRADESEAGRAIREDVLGGRVLWAVCGSAPLSATLATLLASVLRVTLSDGYASTEAGAVLFDGRVMREHVLDYRLEDVPDLHYFRTDQPHPRGELLIRSATLFAGYYQRPDATAEVLTGDGFFRTGDIVAEVGPDELVYLDRRKNLLKLSQGEFVAIAHLEALFAGGPVIEQIYVYGNSERSSVLAVVVPTAEVLTRTGGDPEQVARLVRDSLRRTARAEGLEGYEVPRDFLVETEPFTTANGLLSGVRKLVRPALQERYGERLERRYEELARHESDELRRLRGTGTRQPALDTVTTAARAVLSAPADDLDPAARFVDLGGDSVSAVRLSALLGEVYGFPVPVAEIISPVNDLRGLAAYVERQLGTGGGRPTAGTVHGAAATEVRAGELTLDRFLGPAEPDAASTLPRPADAPRTVLLTGANGYLGRFVALEWLRRLGPIGGELVCVVRGSDDAAARARLDAAFGPDGSDAARAYREYADATLTVVAGDLGEPRFGLEPGVWRELAATVDVVVHAGALVNHVLPYSQLFAPNVLGTAEVIRLAVTGKLKPVTYVSTIGVVTGSAPETADVRVTDPVRRLDEGYANGYTTSKWAGEVLLREAHDTFGLPVTTFRPGLVLAHTRYRGQLNVPDLFTRLLLSVATTGLAPRSFPRLNTPAHYGGLPVDFVAECVAALGAGPAPGFETYHVTSPPAAVPSLDTEVDWLVEAGYPITRIDDYDEWLERFEAALRGLPRKRRQQSLLPLLPAFAATNRAVDAPAISADHFREAVRKARLGVDGEIPPVTADLIRKYLVDFAQLGLLRPGPGRSVPTRSAGSSAAEPDLTATFLEKAARS
ncbi:carboxylic acid reductase [Cryptosporangium japonicum]|uniref:Thioester reductase domain-containing protein n=1 Tax=Cryptosporangium japonicum TaxID=80872 RepID=A0ABN0UZZ3_9ACTN